jgi:hypothetical protein
VYTALVLAEQIVDLVRTAGVDRVEAMSALAAAKAAIKALPLEEMRGDRFADAQRPQ